MNRLIERVKTCKDTDEAIEFLYEFIQRSELIEKALFFTQKKHKGQFRKSGEDYVIHPILVSVFVAYFGGNENMIIASLLHDVVEDTCCSVNEISDQFNPEVAHLVEGLTKIKEIRDSELVSSALNFRKMLLASINDIRVLVIKLCDRLHNMLTLDSLSMSKRKRISEETIVVYEPIAHRLGISSIKNKLEDLSFKYVLPNEYKKIDTYIHENLQQLQLRLNHFTSETKVLMLKNGFLESDFTIERRVKHYYSIYLKMQRKGLSIEEVLDMLAIRVIVNEPIDCYRVLGIIHQNFNPIISRFKDYIAIPKENGYQTIHTTVFNNKSIIESQIRTKDMHKTAEFGVAAHWKYKSGGLNPKLEWLNDFKDQDDSSEDIEEFYEIAKDNLYSEDISVFSPKGDIFTLPRGATVLDFAYEVHTEVGIYAKEAYVNRQRTPFLTELSNGDIVNIVISKKQNFRCSWLNSIKTGKAKNAIAVHCRQKMRDINDKIAIDILTSVFNVREKRVKNWLEKENIANKVYKIATDSIYFKNIVNTLKKYPKGDKILFPFFNKNKYDIKKQKFDNIVIYSNQNVSNILFDYCCHPKRGDDIIGFRKANNVIVHHKFCERGSVLMDQKEQMIFVKWTREAPQRYNLIVSLENERGSLAVFLHYLAKMQIDLIAIELGKSEEGHSDYFKITLELPDKNIELVRKKLKEKYKVIDFVSTNDVYK
ncbi:MAG: bifunctional (p)ppGpp synthetase/guanosine-3',5'-bis(diphosphate) 3'-pyrophosphohydrolase [Sulfurospirillum sp.]|nr:bifunctional (p)ppGpp synthetase/guanosine-3',5'-bis(diphosphate) 3'-pyrophosphohydrolase [Sulfurospirillum sp.]MBL0702379.1 bifunctional (p)ppGpp synthetase/guanosine-3',5'-bis(diphosphate) 3'-pyrophosphohydrolase [Sulfurospirillum sp.]